MKKKVAIITGTRAEFGLLKSVIRELLTLEEVEPFIIATGMHLSPEFGMTVQEIEGENFEIRERIEILLSSDTPIGVSKSMGLAIIGFSEAFARQKPDMTIILGDRFEAFCAAAAATVSRVPIAHIHGGELTFGAMDDSFRHSITKMSHIHFASTSDHRRRIIQMGEEPESVFNVGALGVEAALSIKPISQEILESDLGFTLRRPLFVVTFHPATLDEEPAASQVRELLAALDQFANSTTVFTKANADMQGRQINVMLDEYVSLCPENRSAHSSLGNTRYLSLLRLADVVVGNSSSGIIEAPSLGVPTVNIGNRQGGRTHGSSVINCAVDRKEIQSAIEVALKLGRSPSMEGFPNPYCWGETAKTIAAHIARALRQGIPNKIFYDLKI